MRRLNPFLLLAVTLTLALSAATASAPARAAAPPPSMPGWLDGSPSEDPLQVGLEGSLHDFLANDYDKMVAEGCVAPLSAYKQAATLDRQLQGAYDAMTTAHEALTDNAFASLALISARITQAALEAQVFFATLPAVESALAAEGATPIASELTKAALNNVVALGKLVTQIRSAVAEGNVDEIDASLNALGAANAAASVAAGNLKAAAAAGDPAVGLLGQVLGATKTLYDVVDDVAQYRLTASAAESAYLQAGAHYSTLLGQLKQAVTALKSVRNDCKKKPTLPPTKPGTSEPGKTKPGSTPAGPTKTKKPKPTTPRKLTPAAGKTKKPLGGAPGCPTRVTFSPEAIRQANGQPLVTETYTSPVSLNGHPCQIGTYIDYITGVVQGQSSAPVFVVASTVFVEEGVAHPTINDVKPGAAVIVTGRAYKGLEAWGVVPSRIEILPNCRKGSWDDKTGAYICG